MGSACSFEQPAVVEPTMNLKTMAERIGEMLYAMEAQHCKDLTLSYYYSMGPQDAQYSPNMTTWDRINLDKIGDIIKGQPSLGYEKVAHFLEQVSPLFKMAADAENNMIRTLRNDRELKKWFMAFSSPRYMFDPHTNLEKLGKLVDNDGHSGASFAICCRSVKKRLSLKDLESN